MSDQHRPLRAREGTSTHAVEAHSLSGNVWWLLPPAAALFYPQAMRAPYESGKLLHRASGPPEALAWLAIVVSVGLVYSVPAVGIGVAYLLGQHEKTSSLGPGINQPTSSASVLKTPLIFPVLKTA
jgi:hypothetical protein